MEEKSPSRENSLPDIVLIQYGKFMRKMTRWYSDLAFDSFLDSTESSKASRRRSRGVSDAGRMQVYERDRMTTTGDGICVSFNKRATWGLN